MFTELTSDDIAEPEDEIDIASFSFSSAEAFDISFVRSLASGSTLMVVVSSATNEVAVTGSVLLSVTSASEVMDALLVS